MRRFNPTLPDERSSNSCLLPSSSSSRKKIERERDRRRSVNPISVESHKFTQQFDICSDRTLSYHMQHIKRIQLLDCFVIDVFFFFSFRLVQEHSGRPTSKKREDFFLFFLFFCLIPAAGSLLRMMAHASALARLHHLALLLLSVYSNTVSSQGKHLYDLFHPSSSITTANRSLFIHFILEISSFPSVLSAGNFSSYCLQILFQLPESPFKLSELRGRKKKKTSFCVVYNPPSGAADLLFFSLSSFYRKGFDIKRQIYVSLDFIKCACVTRCQLTCHRFHVWPVAIVFASLFSAFFHEI